MFGLDLLDVVIGLIFVYLMLSLICSALNEMIESWLKHRATDLERGIRELLHDCEGEKLSNGKTLTEIVYHHPLIYSLFQGRYNPEKINEKGQYKIDKSSRLPSYIPARTFTIALMDVVLPEGTTTVDSLAALRGAINSSTVINGKVKQALLALINEAGGDIDKIRQNVENWYNSAMERVGGWYKRRVQKIICLLGLLLTIAVNADTIAISNSLSYDASLRSSLVNAAQEYAKADAASSSASTQTATNDCQPGTDSPRCKLEDSLARIKNLGLPLGWNPQDPRSMPKQWWCWLIKVIGWLLTAVAISLGAPFWFDLLNRFIAVRSTIKSLDKNPAGKTP